VSFFCLHFVFCCCCCVITRDGYRLSFFRYRCIVPVTPSLVGETEVLGGNPHWHRETSLRHAPKIFGCRAVATALTLTPAWLLPLVVLLAHLCQPFPAGYNSPSANRRAVVACWKSLLVIDSGSVLRDVTSDVTEPEHRHTSLEWNSQARLLMLKCD